VHAIDRLRESVDALRDTIADVAGPRDSGPAQVYLDEIERMRAKGLIDERALARALAAKKKAFLDKF
jgi:hypothetical protein